VPDCNHQAYGRIGAFEKWSRIKPEDRTEATAPARAAFMARFDDAPDPEAARKTYFNRLALASAKARRKKAS
jgi:hypothetical protein